MLTNTTNYLKISLIYKSKNVCYYETLTMKRKWASFFKDLKAEMWSFYFFVNTLTLIIYYFVLFELSIITVVF